VLLPLALLGLQEPSELEPPQVPPERAHLEREPPQAPLVLPERLGVLALEQPVLLLVPVPAQGPEPECGPVQRERVARRPVGW
jgi:hypothetical protein